MCGGGGVTLVRGGDVCGGESGNINGGDMLRAKN